MKTQTTVRKSTHYQIYCVQYFRGTYIYIYIQTHDTAIFLWMGHFFLVLKHEKSAKIVEKLKKHEKKRKNDKKKTKICVLLKSAQKQTSVIRATDGCQKIPVSVIPSTGNHMNHPRSTNALGKGVRASMRILRRRYKDIGVAP